MEQTATKKQNVLIVDDSDDLTNVISDFLGMFDYRVFKAGDGVEALEIIDTETMDIVVTDIHMPRMDGYQLTAEICEKYPDLPVVLITGFSVDEARKMAFDKGAKAFVAKPFHLKELKEVIDSIVGR